MLTRLVIQDVVLIDKLTLEFARGLNVFTGETGAGKSIVLDALGLALGGRSDASLIRAGAPQAVVTAEFSTLPPNLLAELAENNGLEIEEPFLLRRVVGKDGKSRAFINDQPISITLLKKIGEELLEIHGQFETHGLLNPATHRGFLDTFGGHAALKQKTADAYATWQRVKADYEKALSERDRAKAEEEFLRAAVSELDELAPQDGETDGLAARRGNLQNREKIIDALQVATQALDGERGAITALTTAGKALSRVADKTSGLNEILMLIDHLTQDAGEASHQLAKFAHDIDAEPDALQRIEERLFALRAVARKHGVDANALQNLHCDLRDKLALASGKGDHVAQLAKSVETSRHAYKKLAEDLSAKRKKAAESFMKSVGKELPPLKLDRAKFIVDVTPLAEDQWNAEGMDRVQFLANTNPGLPAGPLQKIASGGELARFMLALKVVLATKEPLPVLVFDEVDAGVGGATASAVGERLEALAKNVQIFVVTHSPQVAARGAHHLRVSKQTKAKLTTTSAEVLDKNARIEEIARMLSGAEITPAARKAAVSLINQR